MTGGVAVAVIGATGYTGVELCGLLSRHPRARLSGRYTSARNESGPDGTAGLDLERLLAAGPECVFLATPNEVSADLAARLLDAQVRVVDLSGAHRLRSADLYPRWYGFEHPAPGLLAEAVYGLTELCDGRLEPSRLVANPGCYATSALLALRPLSDLLDPAHDVVCDAKSGVSGAGRRSDVSYSFAELSGNFTAYAVAGHRHEPEIAQEAALPPGASLVFVPHLLPVVRGILATCYVTLREPLTTRDLEGVYREAYGRCPFVHVLPAGELPEMKGVVGTPRCDIGFVLRDGGRRAIVVSVIDNLLKGAASQAVQNFNRMFGFHEEEGLR